MDKDFRVGNWVVRPERLCIHLPGKTVHITPKSMAVLDRLARAGGKVVSRNDLLDTVWPGAAVTDDVLTQCIVELRKAFDDSVQDPKYIETIPKKGFRLVAKVAEVEEKPAGLRLAWRAAIAIAVVLIISVAGLWYFGQESQLPPVDAKTVAVLPFADLSPDGDQEFFVDGLTEELIMRLTWLEGLQVTGRASSFYFKNRDEDPQTIGRQLSVGHIVAGSVRRVGGELRVSAKLTDVSNGFHIWSKTYERGIEDTFAIQDEIAEAVATALSVQLSVGEPAAMEGGTNNVTAYEEYLAGKAAFVGEKPHPLQAVEHFERAVELDPGYALAWARLAEACHIASWGGRFDGTTGLAERGDNAIALALSLAPKSREVLLVLAQLQVWQNRFMEARLLLDSLHRRDEGGDIRYSVVDLDLSLKTGRIDDAFRATKSVMRHDPLNLHLPNFVAQLYFIRNRLDDALAERERVYQSGNRGFYIANVTVPIALAAGRRFEIEKWLRRAHDDRSYLYLGQTTIWEVLRENLDDRDAMLESWRKLQSMPELDTFITVWAAWLGDDEMALTSMQRSPDPWFMWTPLLKRVRRTDEFKQIVIDAGLVDYWREFGWGDFCSPTEGDDFECH